MRIVSCIGYLAFILCQLVALSSPSLSQVESTSRAEQFPRRILFAGSSSTYWNDLPNEVAKLISTRGGIEGRTLAAEIVGRSGSDIREYLNPNCRYEYGVKPGQSFLDKLREERFDYVVLMTVCRFIMGDGVDNPDGKAHAEAVSRYCKAIRLSGAEPVFYEMGWGKGDSEEKGRNRIRMLAKQNEIRLYVPCSTAWTRAVQQRSDIALQHPSDSSHPGDLGHFLNMACFYATLKNESPVGVLPREYHVWPHLSKQEKVEKKEQLERSLLTFQPEAYHTKLPEWMRRNAGAGFRAKISEEDALFLEDIAWRTWTDVRVQLSQFANSSSKD